MRFLSLLVLLVCCGCWQETDRTNQRHEKSETSKIIESGKFYIDPSGTICYSSRLPVWFEYTLRESEPLNQKEWIQRFGSQHLQRLVADGWSYEKTYFKERLRFERPGWFVCDDDETILPVEGSYEPSDYDLKRLDEIRSLYPRSQLGRHHFVMVYDSFLGRSIWTY